MRLLKLSLRGVTRFASTVEIDFDALGPRLVALVGANGAGKSTVMEAPAVAIWKSFPSRPGFYDNFSGRDAFIEAAFDGGTVRLAVDAVRKTAEAYVIVDGNPITDGKAASFQAAVAERFGSFELFLASVFACQSKRGSFLGLAKSDRKDLFVELLGLGALQVLSEAARAKAGQSEAALSGARGRLSEIERQARELAGAPAALAEAQGVIDAAAKALETARTEEVAATGALERARSQAARIGELQAVERAARNAAHAAATAVDEAEARAPKAAKRRDERVRFVESRRVAELEPAARKRHADSTARVTKERAELAARLESLPNLEQAEARKAEAMQRRTNAEMEAATIRGADQAVRDAERAEADETRAVDRAVQMYEETRERLTSQSERLRTVPCTKADNWFPGPRAGDLLHPDFGDFSAGALSSTCPLLADAREAKTKLGLLVPVDLSVRAKAMGATKAAKAARSKLPAAPQDIRPLDLIIHQAVADITAAGAAQQIGVRLLQLESDLQGIDEQLAEDLTRATQAVEDAAAELHKILDEYETEILDADAALATARDNLKVARETHSRAEQAARDAATVDVPAIERSLAQARRDREGAESSMREADRAHAAAQAAVDRLNQLAPLRSELAAAVSHSEVAVGDWSLLEKSLGRDGVQALEIDAAGPEVARITNDLLQACYGSRFSLTLETLAEKRDGGTKEVFDVRVYDGGAERLVEALSGGERVVVGEALGLALSIFNARKSTVKWETFFRDETAGALDPVNAIAYVAMLRRARELAGAHQIIFIAHQPEVWEAADAVVVIENGAAVVRGQERAA